MRSFSYSASVLSSVIVLLLKYLKTNIFLNLPYSKSVKLNSCFLVFCNERSQSCGVIQVMTLPFFRSPTQYMHVSEPATHTHRVFQSVLFTMDREWESFRVAGDNTCEGESPRNRRSQMLLANPHKPQTNEQPESGRDLQRSSQSPIRLLLTLSDVTHVAHPVALPSVL